MAKLFTNKLKQRYKLRQSLQSIWFFPLICLMGVIILSILQISGTSAGIHYKDLYGPSSKDPHLIAGKPRSIRSDEWEWISLMTQSQARAQYPATNKSVGNGQDMRVIVDVPYKDWSVIFKPQNLGFLLLPFEIAFALKWWLLAYLLVMSVYFFVDILLPSRRLLAAGLATYFFFSPFIFWWYQSATIIPIAMSLFIIVTTIKLWEASREQKLWWSLLLAYCLLCFSIVLYPPFQIPCAIAALTFLLGYFLEKRFFRKSLINQNILYTGAALFIFALLTFSFIYTNRQAISATRQSVYPGKRMVLSGGFDKRAFFANFLDSQLQSGAKAKGYIANQSEASNFLLLAPFLTLPSLFFLFQQKKREKPLDWPLALVTACFSLFIVRLFVPRTDIIFKILLLESVPHARLLIGIGLLSFMQLVLIIRHLKKYQPTHTILIAIVTSAFACIVNIWIGILTRQLYPAYIHQWFILIPLALLPALIILLLLLQKTYAALLFLLIFSLGSTGLIHPLYRGPGPLYQSNIVKSVSAIHLQNPNSRWAVVDNLVYENLAIAANSPSVTGIYSYPQNDFWRHSPVSAQTDTYNRFAHTISKFSNKEVALQLKQADLFEISGSPCSRFYEEMDVRFFIAEKDYQSTYSCLKLRQKISYPNKTFYILERS